MQVSSFRKLRRVGADSEQIFEMAATLTGTLQLGSDEEDNLADASGFTTSRASAASMRNGGSNWVEGAPRGARSRAKGAHLRLTLPPGTTKVGRDLRHWPSRTAISCLPHSCCERSTYAAIRVSALRYRISKILYW